MTHISGATMGTWFNVKYLPVSSRDVLSADQIEAGINSRLATVDALMSTYKSDSEVSRFNRTPPAQPFPVSPQTFQVIELAQHISEQTEGAFDITVASLVDLWGFGPRMQPQQVPSAAQISQALAKTGYQHLVLDSQAQRLLKHTALTVDLSAIAKGYGVDQVADYLDSIGIATYLVEVGGEVRTRGLKPDGTPWRIAIEAPDHRQRAVQRIINVTGKALATSGDYRNFFEEGGKRFSHTINPQTGYPITHNLASVTVISDTSARADALATAFSVMGAQRAMQFANAYNVAAFFIVKEESGFEERISDAFQPLLH